jgi:hypothetical protein
MTAFEYGTRVSARHKLTRCKAALLRAKRYLMIVWGLEDSSPRRSTIKDFGLSFASPQRVVLSS